MSTLALLLLLILHTRIAAPLYRVEVRRDGIWWVTPLVGGKASSRVIAWRQPLRWHSPRC